VLERSLVVLVASALTALTAISLAGHGPAAGEVLLHVTDRHGLNRGDLLPLGVWATGMTACLVLWRKMRS
jgi:hypothetical protein